MSGRLRLVPLVPLLLVLVGVFGLVAWLLLKGEEGSQIADSLSLGVGLLSLLCASATLRTTLRANAPVPWDRDGARGLSRGAKLSVAVVLAAAMGAGAAFGYYRFVHKPELIVTDPLIVKGHGLRTGERATLHVPGQPPERRHLAFTVILTNPSGAGDCEGSAQLQTRRLLDGQLLGPIEEGRPGELLRHDLDGVVVDAKIEITVKMSDTACLVDLRLGRVVLYN